MNFYDASVLILSCDKNYDLCRWINMTCDCFLKLGIECIVVTENNKDNFDKRIHSYAIGSSGFDQRFVFGVEQCKNSNIIILLDDYFVHDKQLNTKLINWLDAMQKNQLTALRIASNKKKFIKKKRIKKGYYFLINIQPYEIDFHPTIWKKNELLELIKDRKFSPWSLEPCFALFLKGKRSAMTNETILYDELIIQGDFFKRPYKLYCAKDYTGTKRVAKGKKMFIHFLRTFIFNNSPYWLIRLLRKVFMIKSLSAEAKL